MTEIQDPQNHLQFQLSLLRLTRHKSHADDCEPNSESQDEEDVRAAITLIAQSMP